MSNQIIEGHELDLEAPVLQEGTHWAEASELSAEHPMNAGNVDIDSIVNIAQSTQSTQSSQSWADLVNADKRKYAAANTENLKSDSHQENKSSESMVNFSAAGTTSLRHKAEVPPVFIAYKWVSSEGTCISLMQVATAVLKAVANSTALDAIQLMKQG